MRFQTASANRFLNFAMPSHSSYTNICDSFLSWYYARFQERITSQTVWNLLDKRLVLVSLRLLQYVRGTVCTWSFHVETIRNVESVWWSSVASGISLTHTHGQTSTYSGHLGNHQASSTMMAGPSCTIQQSNPIALAFIEVVLVLLEVQVCNGI